MAATIAICTGYDKAREKEAHRLGSERSIAHANTWRTFTTCLIRKDGSGAVSVERDGVIIHEYVFGKED